MTYNPEIAPHRGGRSKEEWDAYRRNHILAHLLSEMRSPTITKFERTKRARELLSTAFRYLSSLEVAECEAIIRANSGTSGGNRHVPGNSARTP